MTKKLICLIITIAMVLTMLPGVAFAANTAGLENFKKIQTYIDGQFTDVKAKDWFAENVEASYELNLMVGRSSKFFDTESNLTVVEAMTIAARLREIYYTGKAEFVQGNPWHQVYTDYCKENKIADPADYDLNKAITRGQFAEIFSKAFPTEALKKINNVQDNMIPDVSKTDKFSAAIYLLYRAGILTGNDSKGTFASETNIKRIEAAAITTRMAQPTLRKSITLVKQSSGGGSYTPPAKYTVTFDLNGITGVEAPEAQTITSGEKVTEPENPTFANHTFEGWYKTKNDTTGELSDEWNFSTDTVTADMTLYAQWSRTMQSILDTNQNIPSASNLDAPANAWVNFSDSDCKAFIGNDGEEDLFVVKKEEQTLLIPGLCMDDAFIRIDENTYKHIENDELTVTVLMTSGVFTSCKWKFELSNYKFLNGTYTPPITKADYIMRAGGTWFTTLTSGTEIQKASITDITFCKEVPMGEKVVTDVNLTDSGNGKVKGYIVANGDNYKIYIVGDYIFGNADCTQMFSGFKNLKNLDLSNFDTSKVTNMQSMFGSCSGLTSITFGEGFDTSEVTNMSGMFGSCSGLTSITFGEDFDTAKVDTMYMMFSGCSCLTSLDISSFDTSKVTNMQSMFGSCSGLTSITFGNKFNAEKVTNMQSMFSSCSALTSLDLSTFNTASAEKMNTMFQNCTKLSEITFGTNFNTASVTTMEKMFNNCIALKTLDLSSFNTVNVSNMNDMFFGCSALTSLNLSNFNTVNVTNMGGMFKGCSALTSLDLSNFNTENVTNMGSMFENCLKLTSVKINDANNMIKTALGDGWNYKAGDKAYTKEEPTN